MIPLLDVDGGEIVTALQASAENTARPITACLLRRPGLGLIPVEGTISPVLDEQRHRQGQVLVLRDVSENLLSAALDKLRSSDLRFRSLVENAADVIIVSPRRRYDSLLQSFSGTGSGLGAERDRRPQPLRLVSSRRSRPGPRELLRAG